MKSIKSFLIGVLFVALTASCAFTQSNVEYLSPLRPEFHVTSEGGRQWTLLEPFRFKVDGKEYEVPAGFWTDFASVPRFIWPIISPYDLGVGCIPHDFGYATHNPDKGFWDSVFMSCMVKDGVPTWKRYAAYHAVSWFGQSAWDSHTPVRTIPRDMYERKSKADDSRTAVKEIPAEAIRWKNLVENLTGAN